MWPIGKYKEDLTGRVFGKLTVLRHYSGEWKGQPNKPLCDCKCECGNEITLLSYRLTNSGKESCGCDKETKNRIDLTGMVFGRLTVLGMGETRRKNESRKRSYTTWVCQCSCLDQTIKEIRSSFLINGRRKSCGCLSREMLDKYRMNGPDEQHPGWKGGVSYYKNRIALYDTYSPQLEPVEETRRNADNPEMLEVQCYHCKTWMIPTLVNTMNRAKSIEGKATGENHFYCSDLCRENCTIFNKVLYPEGYSPHKPPNRDLQVQAELREMVLERDDYTCQRCGSKENLVCHHYEGIRYNPIMSADVEGSVTVCQQCSDFIHSQPGCRRSDMVCKTNKQDPNQQV